MPRPDCARESEVKGQGRREQRAKSKGEPERTSSNRRVNGDRANGMFFCVVACIFEYVNIVIGQNEVRSSGPLSLFSLPPGVSSAYNTDSEN